MIKGLEIATHAPTTQVAVTEMLRQAPRTITQSVSPPHPNAAKLFVNWMLTQEAMQAIANSDGVATTRTDVDYSKVDPNIIPAPNGTYFDENNWAYVTGEQTALFARIKPLLS